MFSFNPGMGAATMRTEDFFNDGEWHNVVLERNGNEGTLYVDGFLKANGTSRGDSVYIDLQVIEFVIWLSYFGGTKQNYALGSHIVPSHVFT